MSKNCSPKSSEILQFKITTNENYFDNAVCVCACLYVCVSRSIVCTWAYVRLTVRYLLCICTSLMSLRFYTI